MNLAFTALPQSPKWELANEPSLFKLPVCSLLERCVVFSFIFLILSFPRCFKLLRCNSKDVSLLGFENAEAHVYIGPNLLLPIHHSTWVLHATESQLFF